MSFRVSSHGFVFADCSEGLAGKNKPRPRIKTPVVRVFYFIRLSHFNLFLIMQRIQTCIIIITLTLNLSKNKKTCLLETYQKNFSCACL